MQGGAIGPVGRRRRLGVLALTLGLAVPLTAGAGPPVGSPLPFTIQPGEQVTLGPGDRFDLKVSGVAPAPDEAEGTPAPRGATSEHLIATPLSFGAAQGTLRFTLWDDAENGARLKLENGLDRAVIYSAEIVYRDTGRVEETTICSVDAGRPALESWPNDLAAVRITGLYNAPAGGQVCGYAARDQLSAPPPSQ
jgi:hypothetical protein